MGMCMPLIVMVGGLAMGMVGCMVVEELVGVLKHYKMPIARILLFHVSQTLSEHRPTQRT